jgi:predicted nucleic acid-binding protein
MAKERRVAALDTCALSFFQQGRAAGAPPDEVRRAARIEHYIRTVQGEDGEIVLPALCLGEHLSQFDDGAREAVKDGIEENFKIIEYGVVSALAFAKMRFDKEAFNAAKTGSGRPAQSVKVDCLIAAVARGYGATEVLTDNTRDFTNLTRGQLAVVEIDKLPNPPVPHPVLFNKDAPPPESPS